MTWKLSAKLYFCRPVASTSPYSVSEILALKPISYENKRQIKARGRPVPDLDIKCSSQSHGKAYVRKFQVEWYNSWNFLCGCADRNLLFCFLCLLFINKGTWAKDGFRAISRMKEKCEKHAASKEQLNSVIDLKLLGNISIDRALDTAHAKSIADHNELVRRNRTI